MATPRAMPDFLNGGSSRAAKAQLCVEATAATRLSQLGRRGAATKNVIGIRIPMTERRRRPPDGIDWLAGQSYP